MNAVQQEDLTLNHSWVMTLVPEVQQEDFKMTQVLEVLEVLEVLGVLGVLVLGVVWMKPERCLLRTQVRCRIFTLSSTGMTLMRILAVY